MLLPLRGYWSIAGECKHVCLPLLGIASGNARNDLLSRKGGAQLQAVCFFVVFF